MVWVRIRGAMQVATGWGARGGLRRLGGVWRGVQRRGDGLQCLPRLPLRLLVSLVHRFKSEAAAAAVEEEEEEEGCAALPSAHARLNRRCCS